MNEKPNFLSTSTHMRMIADAFEDFVKQAAFGVSGDVVVRAYGSIQNCREHAQSIWDADKVYEITTKTLDDFND